MSQSCTQQGLRSTSAVLVCFCLAGCSAEPELKDGTVISSSLPPGFTAERLLELEENNAGEDRPSGRWRYENGATVCDGYMTRFRDQDFCSSEAPDDWVPFEFDGQRFYLHRLAASQE